MLNNVSLIGRLTYQPELKSTPSGVSVVRFQLAVDRDYSKEEKKTDFIDCVAWKYTADFVAKYLLKGMLVGIEGKIQTNDFTDKNGNKRKSTEVVVNNVTFCEKKTNTVIEEVAIGDDDDDDLPF